MSPVNTAAIRNMLRHYTELPATVHLLCLGSFINRAGTFVMLFLTIYLTQQLDTGKAFASYCIGVFGFGSVVSSLLGGQLADQFGRRSTMLLALFGGAAALLALSAVRNPWAFMGALFLFALIIEMYRPASAAMIGDVTTSDQRPHAFGLLYISFNLGFAVAPPIGGLLASQSFLWLFWVDAFTTAMYGIVVLLLIRETRPRSVQHDLPFSAAEVNCSATPMAAAEALASLDSATNISVRESSETVSLSAALRHICGDWTFLLYCLCNLLTNMVFMQAFATLPLYLTGMGFSTSEFALMICVNGILIVAFQLPLTHFLNRYNRVGVLLCGEFLLALGFGLTVFADTAWLIVGTIVLWTFGEIFQAPYKPTIVAEIAPASLRARYMGIFHISYSMSLMIGAPLGGEILARFGPTILWPGCGGLLLLTMGLYLIMFRRLSLAKTAVLEHPVILQFGARDAETA